MSQNVRYVTERLLVQRTAYLARGGVSAAAVTVTAALPPPLSSCQLAVLPYSSSVAYAANQLRK